MHAVDDEEAGPRTVTVAALRVRLDYTHPVRKEPYCAVRDVSFGVRTGEILSVIGPAGCGTSTVFSAIAGLRRPQQGYVRFALSRRGAMGRRAVIFQKAALLRWRTAIQKVAYSPSLADVRRGEAPRRAAEALDWAELANSCRHHRHQRSAGLQRRINLARALVTEPDLFLFDEQSVAVDTQMRDVLQKKLLGPLRLTSMTGISVTHQIDEGSSWEIRPSYGGPAGKVTAIVDVPFPRPGPVDVRSGPIFCDTVRQL